MFGTSRRGLRIVIDCADPRPLLVLRRRPRPPGVKVRCRRALCAQRDTVTSVMQAEVFAPASCPPLELGAWLSDCFVGSHAPWYIDGVPAAASFIPARARDVGAYRLLHAP